MVERYAREKMKSAWSLESKYDSWLEVEKAVVRAWNKLGLIPDEDCEKIIKNARYSINEIDEIEKVLKHDVIAFTTSVANSLGEESRWFHYGITSSDCVDTALSIQIRDSLQLIINEVDIFLEVLKKRSYEFKDCLMVGRSHGIHGEPITFGLVLALWFSEIKRSRNALEHSLEIISVGQMSGAMGNMAHSPFELEQIVCDILGLKTVEISNQVIQRDRIARLINDFAILASSCEKIALAIRHYQRTEVYECEEYFNPSQKGSSAMPHKRNPILSENITGLCRMIRSYAAPAMENIALWHERDISHSSVERFILPDVFITTDFMLNRLSTMINELLIYPKNMMKNLNLTHGLIFSQRVLLELPKKNISREKAYEIVQRNAMMIWEKIKEGGINFDNFKSEYEATSDHDKNNLREKNINHGQSASSRDPLFLKYLLDDKDLMKVISEVELRDCFEYSYYLKNIDNIFKRVFE